MKSCRDGSKPVMTGPVLPAPADAWPEFNLRVASRYRKHGDPFPLPRLGSTFPSTTPTRLKLLQRADAALRSLNKLAAVPTSPTTSSSLPLTSVQTWMMEDVMRRVSQYGDCPPDISEASALADLGKRAHLYTQEANHLVDTDLEKIKILRRRLQPTDAKSLAPPEARGYLEHFGTLVERTPEELEALRLSSDLVEPYWDPGLRRDRARRLQLYVALHQANLLTFRRRRKARVGFFTVKKKGTDQQRLIIDARQANSCHRPPPSTKLSTPAGMVALDLSPGSLEADGFGGYFGDSHVSAESGDVGDCFYNFTVPELSAWFCTDDCFDQNELAALGIHVKTIYDDAAGCEVPLHSNERVFAAFKGIPMGWAWALYIANEIVNHQVSFSSTRPGYDEIRDRCPPPALLPGKPVVGTYVDNVHTFGGRAGEAGARMEAIAERFKLLGIPFEIDHVEQQGWMHSLGLHFSFQGRCTARAKTDRAWTLWCMTRGLLRRRRLSGRLLQVWLGLVNFHFQLVRPALSALSAIYKFTAEHLDRRGTLWPSARAEMRDVLGLIFLVEFDMSAPLCREVHVGDSSDRGYALMSTQAGHSELRDALLHRERWRFYESSEPLPCPHFAGDASEVEDKLGVLGSAPSAGVGNLTQYGKDLAHRVDNAYQDLLFRQRRSRLLGGHEPSATSCIHGPGIPPLLDSWCTQDRWTLVTAKAWENVKEHINFKEARVCLMGLRRLCRTARNLGTTAMSITDNLVSALAFEKGRSSSRALNNLCRRAAAYQIGGRIQWRLRHIESKRNVADEPSRWWGPDFPRPACLIEPETILDTEEPPGVHVDAASLERGVHRHFGHVRGYPQSSKPRYFLELFSGTARLTQAAHGLGVRVLPDFEVGKGKVFNLLRPATQKWVLSQIRSGRLWCVHIGAPCTVWSRARHNIKNLFKARKKEAVGVALALFTVEVIRECLASQVHFSLENPQTSRLWEFGPVRDLFRDKRICFFTFHMCGWGMPFKKPTSILTDIPSLSNLQRVCSKDHRHVHLRGSEMVVVNGVKQTRNRTAAAGAYPPLLCEAWAQQLAKIAPSNALGVPEPQDVLDFLHGLEAAAHGADGPSSTTTSSALRKAHGYQDDGDDKFLYQAYKYIRTHPVVFGHFTSEDIAKLVGYHGYKFVAEAGEGSHRP